MKAGEGMRVSLNPDALFNGTCLESTLEERDLIRREVANPAGFEIGRITSASGGRDSSQSRSPLH